ncbi:MAG: deacylase [Rhizobiales bacterium PAR1]|nr:MAG: deacylase [Rhizobiales bacterium PAR1]
MKQVPLLALLLHATSPVLAADIGLRGAAPAGPISELRLGLGAHDPWSPESGTADLRGEILFSKPGSMAETSLIPRLHLGGALNTGGKTSHAYAGVTWTLDVTQKIFVEASLGGAIHNGEAAARPGRSALGCPALFREALGVGYRIDANWSVMGTFEHLSNSGLCRKNRGLTNLGVMLGYRF